MLDEHLAHLPVRPTTELMGVVMMSEAHRQDGWGAVASRDALDPPQLVLDVGRIRVGRKIHSERMRTCPLERHVGLLDHCG